MFVVVSGLCDSVTIFGAGAMRLRGGIVLDLEFNFDEY